MAESKIVKFIAGPEDLRVLQWLRKKLGLNDSAVIRLAIRRLKDTEK